MPSTTESSAIVRFIRQAQPPILERQHGIETEVVQSPYFVAADAERDRPARRSYAPHLVVALGAAAVAAALILYMYAPSAEVGRAQASAAPAPVAVAEAISAPALAPGPEPEPPEPIVIAVHDEAAEAAASDDPADEAAGAIAPSVEPVLDRSERERPPVRRQVAAARTRAQPRTEVPELVATKGILMIASKPPCHIIIDGEETGLTTPQPMIRLRTGRHQVTLVNQEHDIRATVPVLIEAGKSVRVVKDLTDRMKRDVP
ncbi:MAG TPA: PEGA domain-containing protein [Kofleriaceae bacterium]|nr:PEGA domain-containing protein [Kofleriaceae bacterium]